MEAWVDSLTSGQITEREHSPAHQQKIGLKNEIVLLNVGFASTLKDEYGQKKNKKIAHAQTLLKIYIYIFFFSKKKTNW